MLSTFRIPPSFHLQASKLDLSETDLENSLVTVDISEAVCSYIVQAFVDNCVEFRKLLSKMELKLPSYEGGWNPNNYYEDLILNYFK